MAIDPIGVADATNMAGVEGCLSKGIELHKGMRGIQRTPHTPFMRVAELGPQVLVRHALLSLKGLRRWYLVESAGEIDHPQLLE